MTTIRDLTAGRFMGADDVVDGTIVRLDRIEKEEARNPKTGVTGPVEVMYFTEADGSPTKGKQQGLIITQERAKNLGEMGMVDTDLPIPSDFPLTMFYLIDTGQYGQGVRLKAAPQSEAENF